MGSRRLRFGLVVLLLLGSTSSVVHAGLRFEETAINLGEVRTGTPLAHDFHFFNEGPETLELLEARPSCGCLRPKLPCRFLAPGQGAALRVEVNTLIQAAGPHTWKVHLRYGFAESRQPSEEMELTITARIVTEVMVQPAGLTLVTAGPVSQEIVLTDLRERPMSEIKLATSSPELTATLRARDRDAAGHAVFRIGLQVSGNFSTGRHEEALDIYPNDPLYAHLRVPVTVVRQQRQRLSVLPSEVILRAAPGQPFPSQLLRVMDAGGESVILTAVTADDPAISCHWAAGPGACATVRIQVDRDRLEGTERHTLVHIHTARPVEETLRVPVCCMVR
jgi:hypothetical protein